MKTIIKQLLVIVSNKEKEVIQLENDLKSLRPSKRDNWECNINLDTRTSVKLVYAEYKAKQAELNALLNTEVLINE